MSGWSRVDPLAIEAALDWAQQHCVLGALCGGWGLGSERQGRGRASGEDRNVISSYLALLCPSLSLWLYTLAISRSKRYVFIHGTGRWLWITTKDSGISKKMVLYSSRRSRYPKPNCDHRSQVCGLPLNNFTSRSTRLMQTIKWSRLSRRPQGHG